MIAEDVCGGCRRKNFVQAAYVEAAVYINRMYSSDRAYWMLMREKVPVQVIERVLNARAGRVRHKDRRYATRRETILTPEPGLPAVEKRIDHLTFQHVEVGLVFHSMLGIDAANEYLRGAGIPAWVSARVLTSAKRRPSLALIAE